MTIVRVAHPGADYQVIVGQLAGALPMLVELGGGELLPVISDARVFELHGHQLAGVALADPILLPEGEAAKDWATLGDIVERLAALGVKRGTPVVAFGGGSIGDVAGLAASLFKRGCPIVHVPTTLLAQVDSAVGGKTAIDAAGQKNLVGSFHHPALVIADPSLLDTLDQLQLRSGYAEVIKYGLIDDSDFFQWCETRADLLLGGDLAVRQQAVEHCVGAKVRIVSADPGDSSGIRALLNFGHTFGHAIEAVGGHRILHGEAVALGMVLAFDLSARLSMCPLDDAVRVKTHVQSIGLPVELGQLGLSGPDIFTAMQSDKKATRRGLTLVLTRGIGQAFVCKEADSDALRNFLATSA